MKRVVRGINNYERLLFVAIFLAIQFFTPERFRIVFGAFSLLIFAVYNAYIARERSSYIILAVAIVLMTVAIIFPPAVPAGPPPVG